MRIQAVGIKTEPMAARAKRGRKPASESRATEIRIALAKWRQIPEEQRPSLRALAADLKTSHQLLCSFLRTLDDWINRQRSKEYGRMAKEISDSAMAEERRMTQAEQERFEAYNGASVRCLLDGMIEKAAARITLEFHSALKRDKKQTARRCAKLLARMGNAEAKRFLQTGETSHSGPR